VVDQHGKWWNDEFLREGVSLASPGFPDEVEIPGSSGKNDSSTLKGLHFLTQWGQHHRSESYQDEFRC
jgi:hypothetical protein